MFGTLADSVTVGPAAFAFFAGSNFYFNVNSIKFGITDFNLFTFVGTSLLIVVGVALETVRDLEAQLAMRNYKGFLD